MPLPQGRLRPSFSNDNLVLNKTGREVCSWVEAWNLWCPHDSKEHTTAFAQRRRVHLDFNRVAAGRVHQTAASNPPNPLPGTCVRLLPDCRALSTVSSVFTAVQGLWFQQLGRC